VFSDTFLSDLEFARYKCEIGDLLITRTGSLGTLAVFNDVVDAIPGAYLIHYRLAVPMATSWYIYYVIKSPKGQKHLINGATGVGRSNLNVPTLESLAIPLPPFAEQQRIVEEVEKQLSMINEARKDSAANLLHVTELHKSILKQAFSGELVPQDPTDEPATKLLERIQEERAKREQEEKIQKRTQRERGAKVKKETQRRGLYEVLVEAKIPLSPNDLFDQAHFTDDEIDEFYEELRKEVPARIEQIRPNKADVYLKVVKNEA
jgi:type I restriction enzyme S subunit